MPRDLLIPFALVAQGGVKITASELAEQMADPRSQLRLQATADRDTERRRAIRFSCPACGHAVYPHAPVVRGGRYFWSHRPKAAAFCPLERKRALSPDEINRLIFWGRQESEAHRNLVRLLASAAERDPRTVEGSTQIGVYEPPTPEMRDEFPYGRYPDVSFVYGREKVVLEAQLATISLYGINGRRAFYDRSGATLLWVMRNFSPDGPLRASVLDILADQAGHIFAVDRETEELSRKDRTLRLRCWRYDQGSTGEIWSESIITLGEAIRVANPWWWARDFKKRWIEAYEGENCFYGDVLDPHEFILEAAREADLTSSECARLDKSVIEIVRLLIALEAGRVIGTRNTRLISMANSFHRRVGYRARTLVVRALERWQPALLEKPSMKIALNSASNALAQPGEHEWGQTSPIGKLRSVLFPDWKIEPQSPSPCWLVSGMVGSGIIPAKKTKKKAEK